MKRFLLSLVLLPTALLFADSRAPVNVRPLSSEQIEQRQQMRENETPQNNTDSDISSLDNTSGYYYNDSPPFYCPPPCHWMCALSALGDSMMIEDGSIWQLGSYDRDLIRYWFINDPLVITQNGDWFSSYDYRIINRNTGSSVAVNLLQGPVLDDPHSRQIAAIDLQAGIVILSPDDLHWSISSRDRYQLDKWVPGDYVIVGINTGWDSSFANILINVATNSFVRAKQY